MSILCAKESSLAEGRRSCTAGQAVLALVFIIGGLIALMGLTMAFLATSFINIAAGFQAAEGAAALANSGAEDALMRLSRAKNTSTTYSMPIDGNSVSVTITQNSPSSGLVTIISSSTVSRRERRVRVVVSRNATSGAISLVSWEPF